MKILVTGATGFLGSHLCDKLNEQGHEIFALYRSEKKVKQFNTPGTLINGSISSLNENQWIKDLPEDLDAVIHTAGIVHSMYKNDFYNTNTKGTQILFDQLRSRYKKLNFVFISSLAAAGPVELGKIRNEEDKGQPVSHYGASKLLAERYITKNCPKEWNLNIIRPPMVIGPRDPAVLDIFKMVKDGTIITTGKSGKKKEYSIVCVHDLVDVIINSLSNTSDQKVFYTSFPKVYTFEEIINTINKNFNNKIRFISIPEKIVKFVAYILQFFHMIYRHNIRLTPDKAQEIVADAWTCSGKKSENILGTEYKFNLERTIQITLEDYKGRGWLNN